MKKLFAVLVAIGLIISAGRVASVAAVDPDEYVDIEELIPRH